MGWGGEQKRGTECADRGEGNGGGVGAFSVLNIDVNVFYVFFLLKFEKHIFMFFIFMFLCFLNVVFLLLLKQKRTKLQI